MAENRPNLELTNSLILSSIHSMIIKIPNLVSCSSHNTIAAYPAATAANRQTRTAREPVSTRDLEDGGGPGQGQIPSIRLVAPPDPPHTPHASSA
jgi:hypothetical protein